MSVRLDYVGIDEEDVEALQAAIDAAMITADSEAVQREADFKAARISVFVTDNTSITDIAACDALMKNRGFERVS